MLTKTAKEIEKIGISRDAITAVGMALLGGAVFGLTAFESIVLSRIEGDITAVWIPNAIAVAFLLRAKLKREDMLFFAIWCANMIANIASGNSLFKAGGFATANLIEIMLAVMLVRWTCGRKPDMTEIGHLTKFIAIAGLLAPVISAMFAGIVFILTDSFTFLDVGKWILGDALGMMLIAPALLIFTDAAAKPRRLTALQYAEWVGLALTAAALTTFVFMQQHYPLLFLVAPIVLVNAFRLGSLGTAMSIMIVAAISIEMTALNYGLIAQLDTSISIKLLLLQAFLVAAYLMGLPIAAILNTRKRMSREIIERENRYKMLADNVTDAIMGYDSNGKCVYISPSGEEILGVPAEEFLEMPPEKRYHPESFAEVAAAQRRLTSGETTKERLNYRRYLDDENNNPVYIEADCATAYSPTTGEFNGIIISARNVTDRVALEHQLVRARSHAENAANAKSQFLANMSHEIRTPMNGVLGFADLLLDGTLQGEQRRQAELIAESGRTMMMLLNDILDISKIEAGQVEMRKEPVDLEKMLSGCVRLHAANAAKKNLVLRHRSSKDLPATIISDQLRLRQVLLNLIGNAVKFTGEGSVTLSASVSGDKLMISVDDTGIGIDPNRLEEIFHPFEQADGAISRSFGGTGLGLTISRQLVGLMGGSLSVDSRIGQGSSFKLEMPLQITDEEMSSDIPGLNTVPQELPPPSRILLAEDHDINRMLMTAMLERCGQQVIIACDGQEAIEMVAEAESKDDQFDLVLMDIQMPRCDGYTATETIRGTGISPDQLPILALTANAFPEDIAAAIESGMQAHVAKPVVFEHLLCALGQWLPKEDGDETPEPQEQVVEQTAPEEQVAPQEQAAPEAQTAPQEQPAPQMQAPPPAQVAPQMQAPPQMQAAPAADAPSEHSPALLKRWNERRSEALDAVSNAMNSGALGGEDGDELARIVHKLAGTAAMFGEAELGEIAKNFEHSLRSGADMQSRCKLAKELLEAAC